MKSQCGILEPVEEKQRVSSASSLEFVEFFDEIWEGKPLRQEINFEDEQTAVPRSTIDDEYANATEGDPKILLTTSHGPRAPLKQFVKEKQLFNSSYLQELKFVFPNFQRMNRGGQLKYRDRVTGLILVSPLCKAPSWTEWFYYKLMSNLLYYYGMCGLLKECLLQRYFSKEVLSSMISDKTFFSRWSFHSVGIRCSDLGPRFVAEALAPDNPPLKVGGFVVGYQNLTFVTIRGAGHFVPTYQPARGLVFFSSFLEGKLP
ncbi:hypothetical protein L1987_44441 [Smallanthus sonchifolius]|uniref:Uncharacterized protein n=1 Tax=Smallanthus sonchifolius TaxID=185202 RepID=A0ACB9GPB1_9ASTR|nr:hypothetical protein L1987_44441 [Smallanthus sonchifolius]